MRGINDNFINDLLDGELSYFLETVKSNRDKLSLEIRGGYINIYYKGGNLLKITYHKKRGYEFGFDERYCLNKKDCSGYDEIKAFDHYSVLTYKENFYRLIAEMDSWFAEHPKAERDYQHRLLVSNPEIIDVEYQVGNRMRLDMLVWHGGKLVLVENKYGLGSVGGSAGLAKHYKDMWEVWENPDLRADLIGSVVNICDAKKRLGLADISIDKADICDCEILFILAGYNSRSRLAMNELGQMSPSLDAKLIYMDASDSLIDWKSAVNCFAERN